MKMRTLGLIISCLAGTALSAAEPDTQLEWSVSTGLSHTDNATRVATDPVSDTIGSVGGAIDLSREGSRVNATLRGDGKYLDYFDDTYDSDFLGSATANIRVGLVGDALTWNLDDTFGQTTLNEAGPSTPDNRGHVNVVSTGPDLRLAMGSATALVAFGRYENTSYESGSNLDSHSWTGGAAVVRRVSPAVDWSLNADATREVYDATGSLSYNKQEVFARLEADRPRHTLTADLGAGFLDQGDLTDSSPLIRVNWTRRLTPSWSLAFDAGSEYQTSSEQFVAGVTDGTELGGTQDVILTDLAHRADFAAFSLDFKRPRTILRLSSGVGRESFPGSASLDRDGWEVEAEAFRRITQRLNAFVDVSYERRDFSGSNEEDKTTTVTAGIDWRLGKALFLGVSGYTERRSGNTGFDYDENVYQVFLAYRPTGLEL